MSKFYFPPTIMKDLRKALKTKKHGEMFIEVPPLKKEAVNVRTIQERKTDK